MHRVSYVQTLIGSYEEYKQHHLNIWPEMKQMFQDHKVSGFTIDYLASTNQLFCVIEYEDQALFDQISKTKICQDWWALMMKYVQFDSNNIPVTESLDFTWKLE